MSVLLENVDHQALGQLVTEFFWRVDHGRADSVYELFSEPCELTIGTTSLCGLDEIKEWGLRRAANGYRTRHCCSNMRFVAEEADRAFGTTIVTVYRSNGEESGSTLPLVIEEFSDQFVRTDAGWSFISRNTEILFVR